jgi:hypothetical protein
VPDISVSGIPFRAQISVPSIAFMTTMTDFVIIIALKQLSLFVCCAAFKVRPDGGRIPSKRATDHDGKVTPTADVEVAKHARINTSGAIFQLVQDFWQARRLGAPVMLPGGRLAARMSMPDFSASSCWLV